AALVSLVMVRQAERIERRGVVLLWAVAGYGAATVAIRLSRTYVSALASLAAIGACDMVSTVLRNVVRQLATPDRLRGRMTAVNMLFFMGGPQLGEVEAGLVANRFGAPFSVVTGGLACLAATGLTAWLATDL